MQEQPGTKRLWPMGPSPRFCKGCKVGRLNRPINFPLFPPHRYRTTSVVPAELTTRWEGKKPHQKYRDCLFAHVDMLTSAGNVNNPHLRNACGLHSGGQNIYRQSVELATYILSRKPQSAASSPQPVVHPLSHQLPCLIVLLVTGSHYSALQRRRALRPGPGRPWNSHVSLPCSLLPPRLV